MSRNDIGGLKAYLTDIGRHPLLDKETTNDLFVRYNDEATPEPEKVKIKQTLINANLRLVVSIAKKYRDQGVPMLDLIQEGNEGLMKGVDRFDPSRGFRLSTYASHWIKQAICRHLTETSRTVRLPSHIVALLPKIRAKRRDILDEEGFEPDAERLAKELEVTEDSVRAALDASGPVYSVDLIPEEQSGGKRQASQSSIEQYMHNSVNWHQQRDDLEESLARDQLKDIVRNAFVDLTQREEQVLRLRFGCMEDPNNEDEFPISDDELAELEARAEEEK
jgi:RNA polymerase primary sigma factor